jgi:hypothetical protein
MAFMASGHLHGSRLSFSGQDENDSFTLRRAGERGLMVRDINARKQIDLAAFMDQGGRPQGLRESLNRTISFCIAECSMIRSPLNDALPVGSADAAT